MKCKIYLDNNASCPLDPHVLAVMNQSYQEHFGNPSSVHAAGRLARAALNTARDKIASYLNVLPQEILFTSGGTEGISQVFASLDRQKKGHIITSSVEHACVWTGVHRLQKEGFTTTFLSPGFHGAVTAEEVEKAIKPDTCLIAIMAVNNETGVKTDIESIAKIADRHGISLLIDAVALLGKESFTIPHGVSAMCFSGHKVHAPKGIGFSYVSRFFKMKSLIIGGEQELGRRGGTENLTGIVALGEAIELLKSINTDEMLRLRKRLEKGILNLDPSFKINGEGERISNTVNIAFSGFDGETLLIALDLAGIATSHGSACTSGSLEPSRVLLNMGYSQERAASSLRLSLSRMTTEEEIDETIRQMSKILRR